MAIVYQSLTTQDSGGLKIAGVSGANGQSVRITVTFHNSLNEITSNPANSYAVLFAADGTSSQTAIIGGNWSNGSNIILTPGTSELATLTAGASVDALFAASSVITEIYLFDNTSTSQAFLLQGVQVSGIRLEDGNGARDFVITDGAITDPSGFATIVVQDGNFSGHFLDTAAPTNDAPVVTLSSTSQTIITGGSYTLPMVTVADDNDSGLAYTWTAVQNGSSVPIGSVDSGSSGTVVFTATSDPDSGGLTGSANFTLTIEAQAIPDIPRLGFTIAGQSNAQGQGTAEAQDKIYTTGLYPIQDRVTSLGIGFTTLEPAVNPLKHHNPSSAWTGFWKTMAEGIDGNITMIPTASGGTKISEWAKGTILYNHCVTSMSSFIALNAGNKHQAFIWCQGESDAGYLTQQEYFDAITQLRADLIVDTAMTENTRWYVVGIKAPEAHAPTINAALQQFADSIPNGKYVNTTDLTLQDQFHYDAASLRTIGDRLATSYNTHVIVGDDIKPVITLTSGTDTVTVGSTWTDAGATWTDNVDGSGTIPSGTGTVDTNTVGTYTVTYDYTDAAGNVADTVTRTVNVVAAADTEKPVLTLNGQSTVTHTQGEAFADLGASWTDNVDGSGTVYADTALNVNLVGTQTLTYNYTDGAGNVADPVTRTVTVNAVITGDDPVIYGQVDIVGSLRSPTAQTIMAHDGDTLKITPTILDNDNQPLTIGSLSINVFGAAQAIGHGASVFATASSANQNKQIEVMVSGPNGGQRVAAVITVEVI